MSANAFDESDVPALPSIPRTRSSEHPLLEARHVDDLTHAVRALSTVLTRSEALLREQLDAVRFIARNTSEIGDLRREIAALRDAIVNTTGDRT